MSKTLAMSKETYVLLALWDLGGAKSEVKKGDLTRWVVKKTEKSADYQPALSQLEQSGAIIVQKNKISLLPNGLAQLQQALHSPDFMFKSAVGAKTVNTLLKWIREMGKTTATPAANNGKAAAKPIASYDEFKTVALDVFDRLNRDFNMDNLVPIYRIRREIGDRVERSEFNEWLLKMQENDILQLLEGTVEDSAPDKIEDSITTRISGLRCYTKRLDV